MAILIGMDEAGYGPNLGPLVVAATAWEVAEENAWSREQGAGSRQRDVGFRISDFGLRATNTKSAIRNPQSAIERPPIDLYRRLRRVVSDSASDTHVAIADSKMLYKPGHGLRQLERGVHAVLAVIRHLPDGRYTWSQIVDGLGADPDGRQRALPWHESFDCPLPVDASAHELTPLGDRLRKTCESAGVRPLAIRARLVFPAEFNELCEFHESKGAALSQVTIGLLREIVDGCKQGAGTDRSGVDQCPNGAPIGVGPLFALCDKHGARNRYAALLQHHFPDHWIEPLSEGHTESLYEFGPTDARIHVAFRMQGEAFLPTALASMTAKYLRELAMRAFNEYWCARVPGLRPTAGYPADAPRFKQAIAAVQRELSVADHALWRNR